MGYSGAKEEAAYIQFNHNSRFQQKFQILKTLHLFKIAGFPIYYTKIHTKQNNNFVSLFRMHRNKYRKLDARLMFDQPQSQCWILAGCFIAGVDAFFQITFAINFFFT